MNHSGSPKKMPEPPPTGGRSRPRAGLRVLVILVLLLAADLSTKTSAFNFLGCQIHHDASGAPFLTTDSQRDSIYQVFPGFALEASLNLGAFNGWFSGMTVFLIGISVLSIFACFWFSLMMVENTRLMVLALALISSGAAGNLYDRWLIGGVRDFLRCSVWIGEKEWVWPNFNIADSAIVCGVAIILIRETVLMRRERATMTT